MKVKITEEALKLIADFKVMDGPSVDMKMVKRELLVKMALINKKEGGNGIFPHDSYMVRIWSCDPEPPHFHIEKAGWDISFTISDGELYEIESEGSNQQDFNYIVSNVKEWLVSASTDSPKITNYENALATWTDLRK